MLAHDEFHDFVARRLREAARQVFEGPEKPGPLWGPPSASGTPPTNPQVSPPKPAEIRPPDPVDPDWGDGPARGGPGAG
jgi:hypothetical protein